MAGPLEGLRIVEIAGLGAAPFAAMMLADHGAEIIRVERPADAARATAESRAQDILARSRSTTALDLKSPDDIAKLRALVRQADGLIEGFRPGVMERLGLGPDVLLEDNPRLVYGRMTGWGQDGPIAAAAGHDINFIALTGVLDAIGRKDEAPLAPLNLIGDFGGGAMLLAFGMLAALHHSRATGKGQVVDCAMTEGASLLMGVIWSLKAQGYWRDSRGTNILDSGAPFYETYETSDGKWVAVGAIEPQFYAALRGVLGIAEDATFDAQMDSRLWDEQKQKLAAIFRTRTRDEWVAAFDGIDACFSPVLTLDEAAAHPHAAARQAFMRIEGVTQPAPAPRFSAGPITAPRSPSSPMNIDLLIDAWSRRPEREDLS